MVFPGANFDGRTGQSLPVIAYSPTPVSILKANAEGQFSTGFSEGKGEIRLIKGINRQIIEVIDTGNPYFERALLVVRPGFSDVEPGRLHEEAQRVVRGADGYTGLRLNRRRRRRQFLMGSLTGLFGMLAGALLMALTR